VKRHGPTRQSSTESHTAEGRTEICVGLAQLREIGEQAVTAVAASLARGGPVIKGQLIASRFYEAMQHELKRLHAHDPKRAALIAASERCERIATAKINPNALLDELRIALAVLTDGHPEPAGIAADRRRPFQLTRLFLLWTLRLTAARLGRWSLSFRPASLSFHTSAQCIHQIDDFRWRTLSGCFDLFTGLLFLQQLFQRILVVIFERVRIEMPGFGFDDGGTANEHDPEQRERGPQPEEATAPIALSHQAPFRARGIIIYGIVADFC
jgi:hypothetical protein